MAIIKGAKFDEGEKVLCYHRQKLYPAKCTQVERYSFCLQVKINIKSRL